MGFKIPKDIVMDKVCRKAQ